MRRIISLLTVFVTLNSYCYGYIKYFNNNNADIIVDIQTNEITFFVFGGSSDGSGADFAINSIVKQNQLGQYIGNIQDLYISEIYNYKVDRPNRKINFEIKDSILKINELDCFGLCPLFSIFLGIYTEKEDIPLYLADMFRESQMKQNNILFDIKNKITKTQVVYKTIHPHRQYLYNSKCQNSQTKMYLIRGDKVKILKDEGDWLYILYQGKREIKKWIPRCAVIVTNN